MTTHTASCSCGALRLVCESDPIRVSICHCLACQQRTGSAFGVQARFALDRVRVEGEPASYARTGDSGGTITFRFCARCGSTVFWEVAAMAGFVGVAVGAFADPAFAPPTVSIYEARMHGWVTLPEGVQHID